MTAPDPAAPDSSPPFDLAPAAPLMDGSSVAHPDQALADDTAAGLAQLGWMLRQHPWLAPELRWELSGLAPRMLVSAEALHQLQTTAAAVGARCSLARHSSAAARSVVFQFGQAGSVRLLLSSPVVDPAPLFTPAGDYDELGLRP